MALVHPRRHVVERASERGLRARFEVGGAMAAGCHPRRQEGHSAVFGEQHGEAMGAQEVLSGACAAIEEGGE